MAFRYYSILRPVSMGTFPEPEDNHILQIHNFGEQRFVCGIGRTAWGYIDYEKQLPKAIADQYELMQHVPAEDKVKICQRLCKTLQLTRRFSDLYTLGYDPEKEIVTAYFPDHSTNINVAADSGITMITDILNRLAN